MFEVGDLVTVDSEALKLHVHKNVWELWKTCELGIVIMVEGHANGDVILVKVHFTSLSNAYWLYAHEVIPVTAEGK